MTTVKTAGTPIVLASDHAGVALKAALANQLRAEGYAVEDLGPQSSDSVDYPDFAHALAIWMKDKLDSRGILICGSGIGMSIAANRHPHIRAALVSSPEQATLSRQHNDANVLCIGARFMNETQALAATQQFLTTAFEGGRHENRVRKITP